MTVVNIGRDTTKLKIGDSVKFRVNYAALLRLMSCKYIERIVKPNLDDFSGGMERKKSFAEPVEAPELADEN